MNRLAHVGGWCSHVKNLPISGSTTEGGMGLHKATVEPSGRRMQVRLVSIKRASLPVQETLE